MAKFESGHAEWHTVEVDLRALVQQAVATTAEMFREKQCTVEVVVPDTCAHADGGPGPLDAGHVELAVKCGQVCVRSQVVGFA